MKGNKLPSLIFRKIIVIITYTYDIKLAFFIIFASENLSLFSS